MFCCRCGIQLPVGTVGVCSKCQGEARDRPEARVTTPRDRRALLIALSIGALLLLQMTNKSFRNEFYGGTGTTSTQNNVQNSAQNAANVSAQSTPNVVTVTYVVDGCLEADVTYANESGGTEQRVVEPIEMHHGKVQLTPWTLGFRERSGYSAYISAQGEPVEGVEMEGYPGCYVQLMFNGQVVQEASSGSYYGIATASARVP